MYARFGQELSARETMIAAAVVASAAGHGGALISSIADALPQPSAATRQRLATKLLQRLAVASRSGDQREGNDVPSVSPNGESGPLQFARLLAGIEDTQARGDLIYYAAARADRLVEAIAREILYPYFIEGRIPSPFTEDEFLIANGFLLLAPEPIITVDCVAEYAKRVWAFDCERTIGLALRILRQAGILLPCPFLGDRGRIHAYTLAPHGISLPALLWCLYEEFQGERTAVPWDRVAHAGFARLFVIPPAVVASRIWEAERSGLVGTWNAAGIRRVSLKVREPDALICLLLAGLS